MGKALQPLAWKNVKVPLGKLKPWVRNPREITKTQADRLGESLDEFGQVDVFAIGPDFDVYNGHQRLGVLLGKFGPKYVVDCRQASRALNEKERQKLTILLHASATGQWNWDAVSSWDAADLGDWGIDKELLKGAKRDVNALTTFLQDYKKILATYDGIKGGYRRHINGILGGMRSYFNNGHSIMRDVWEFDKVYGDERHGHATPKPLGMTERCIMTSSAEGGVVYEPFSGSGTTLIACENLGRKCCAVELSPGYVAVALERWSTLTGQTPKLEGAKNGKRKQ